MVTISHLLRYPLKSCRGEFLRSSDITKKGLKHDRIWALFDAKGQVVTGRQHPQLLDIKIDIRDEKTTVILDNRPQVSFDINMRSDESRDAKIFSYEVQGYHVSKEIDQWFSEYLEKNVQLLYSENLKRPVLEKHGGAHNDIVSFADQAPILLLSEESLSDLNKRLPTPITFHRFRPNIVVKGCEPYEEDKWKNIRIGKVDFEVIQKCERCIFTTIDPKTKIKDSKREPLNTLSTYRKNESGGIDFGVHLVPRSSGKIRLEEGVFVS